MGVSRRTRRISTSAALALVLALAGAASPVARPGEPGSPSVAALTDATFGQDSTQPNASVTVVGPSEVSTPPPAIRIAATGPTAGAAVQADIADVLLDAYRAAVTRSPADCHLPVSLLAAIGQVESGSLVGRPIDRAHRTSVLGPVLDGNNYAAIPDTDGGQWDGDTKWDRAVGPMQFVPGTWRTFGVDADGDGVAHPQDVEDAAAGTAAYLCYGGRDLSDPAGLRTAILSYNHSVAYLRLVLTYQQRFAGLGLDDGTTVAGLPTHLALSAVEATPDGWAAGRVSAHAPRAGGKAAKHRAEHARATKSARPSSSASASPSGTPSPSPAGTTTLAAAPPAGTTSAAPSPSADPSPSSDPTPSSDPPSPSSDPPSPSSDPSPASTCPTAPPDPDATPSPSDTPSPTPTDGACPPCPPGTDPTEQAPCLPATEPSTEPSPDPSPSSAPASPSAAATTDASSSSAP